MITRRVSTDWNPVTEPEVAHVTDASSSVGWRLAESTWRHHALTNALTDCATHTD